MKRLFTLIALFAVMLGAGAQTQNVFEWKNNSVTIRTTSDIDSVTFSLPEDAVTFTTGNPSVLTENSMTASFSLNSELLISNSSSTTEQGVCYSSESAEPTVEDEVVKYGTLYKGTWQGSLSGLRSGLKYYYRPYLKVANAVFYGSVKSFTTLGDYVEFPEYAVDLGLPSGTLWADRNVGADSPEDYGDYFAWGETEPKDYYDWSPYKWCKGSYDTMTKYCTDSEYGYNGFTDGKTTLEPSDDAATVNMGSSWRMPTKSKLEELKNGCTWTWTTRNSKKGYKVTGPNGNSIFLPAAGYRNDGKLYNAGSKGYCWSSSLDESGPCSSYCLYFRLDDHGLSRSYRVDGHTVRAVVR